MKILFIGGTGTISMAVTRRAAAEGHDLFLLNRGNRKIEGLEQITCLQADINQEEEKVKQLIAGHTFDVVADFIAFTPEQLERDYRLFQGKTRQFIFVSSASAYQKPASDYRIDEGTPLANPYWDYSRRKQACEDYLRKLYREKQFPVTIVRPSHTYDERTVPLGIHGAKGSWQNVKRMLEGKPVIIHGDGTSLWTLTHSTDFAKGFAGLMGNIHAIGEAVQITSDETLTWNQIYQTVADALGAELHPYYVASAFLAECGEYDFRGSLLGDKANSVVFVNNKLKRLVPDFVATKRFDTGVRESLAHILAHPELQVEDPEYDAWCDRLIEALENAKKAMK